MLTVPGGSMPPLILSKARIAPAPSRVHTRGVLARVQEGFHDDTSRALVALVPVVLWYSTSRCFRFVLPRFWEVLLEKLPFGSFLGLRDLNLRIVEGKCHPFRISSSSGSGM